MRSTVGAWHALDLRPFPRLLPCVPLFSLTALALPCLYLAWNRGGTPPHAQGPAFAWIFLSLAIWTAAHYRTAPAAIPWLALPLLAWPLIQLTPLPLALLGWLAPERARELARFAAAGVSVAPTLTLAPDATVRVFLMLAAGVAVFILARQSCRRAPETLLWMALAVVAMALAQALPALRHFLAQQAGPDDTVRGAFGNRNLLAAWLEGGYGVALGLFLARPSAWRALPPLLLAVAAVCTYSRMGIVGVAAVTLLLGAAELARDRWRAAALAALVLAAVLGAAAAGLIGLGSRFSIHSLLNERHGRLAMWSDSLAAAQRYLPGGAGLGAFPYAFRRSHPYLPANTIDHPHNEYLETAVEWGAPAAVLILAGLALAFWRIARRLDPLESDRCRLARGCLAGAASLLLHAAVDFPLRIPAIFLLFCLLIGLAAGAAGSPPLLPRRWRAALAAAGTIAASLALAMFSFRLHYNDGSAEARFRGARLAAAGPQADPEAAYRGVLERNPYLAPAWHELALAAEARGDSGPARRSSDLALALEPHTRRGQWGAANLRLRLGDPQGALALFAPLVRHSPELRGAVWDAAWRAPLPAARILDELVEAAPDALQQYCLYLLGRDRPDALLAAARLDPRALGPETVRSILDRFFQAGSARHSLAFWDLLGGAPDWVVRPTDGVSTARRDGGLDIDFLRPQNLDYAGVWRDFPVTPGRSYRLRFEAAAEGISSSSGPQVEIVSPRRRLAVSEPLRRSSGWRPFELRFVPSQGESLCRVRIIRAPGLSFDNQITGRYSIRRLRLDPAN